MNKELKIICTVDAYTVENQNEVRKVFEDAGYQVATYDDCTEYNGSLYILKECEPLGR
jgi:hypothetical protein